jgi:hypothetical protein
MSRLGPIARVLLVLAAVLVIMYALSAATAGGR